MSRLDRELEAAYAAQEKQKADLERSKRELESVSESGVKMARTTRRAAAITVAVVALSGAAVLMIDPESRPWGLMLAFCVAVAGLWSYYRHLRG